MGQLYKPIFVDRYKANGMIELVCVVCHSIVITTTCQEELEAAEKAHFCPALVGPES